MKKLGNGYQSHSYRSERTSRATRKQAESQAENFTQQLSRQDSMNRTGMVRLLKAIREKDGQAAWSILDGRSHLPGEKVSLQPVTEWKGSRRKRN